MRDVRIEEHHSTEDVTEALRADVRQGLSASPKWLPSKWLYDARGSALFERITELGEYYPTRAEREILTREADSIAAATGAHTLVELGSGSSEKTRVLLNALLHGGTLRRFVPLDVSVSALSEAADAIARDYPDLAVHGVVDDFTTGLDSIPGERPRLVAFLGGTIGNFFPAERGKFLRTVRDVLGVGEWFLLGTDVVKDVETLVRAYDDSEGVTAEFNRNVLRVLNTRLGTDFEPDRFEHVAHWDPDNEWIEMRLRARTDTTVRVPGTGLEVRFAEGEHLRTEISAKFRFERVRAELAEAGFEPWRTWTDTDARYAVSLCRALA